MGYLICDNCGGYYELQGGESLSDFNRCTCGGSLSYHETINYESNTDTTKKESQKDHDKTYTFGSSEPLNRKWILIYGILFIIAGLTSNFIFIGILTLFLGIFLFFTDSWILYLIIFLLWTFGGIIALLGSQATLLNLFAGLVIIGGGVASLHSLYKKRKSKVSGHI